MEVRNCYSLSFAEYEAPSIDGPASPPMQARGDQKRYYSAFGTGNMIEACEFALAYPQGRRVVTVINGGIWRESKDQRGLHLIPITRS